MSDVAGFRAACADDAIPRWTGFPYEMTEEEASRLVRDRIRATDEGTSISFAVVDRAETVLGSVSLLWLDWPNAVGWVAYWLRPESRGAGIGTRAVVMLCEWAFESLGLARLQLTVDVRNDASRRLAERAGFRLEGTLRSSRSIHGERIDEYLYSLLPSDVGAL
jgi:RimJ/RimL family protein N-acetyltransferase